MRHLNFKRDLIGAAGFVLPTAMIALLIVTVLIGAAITVAAQTSTSTTRDDNTKAALEAAEAGLEVATYRLTKLEPGPNGCITGTKTYTPPSGGYCEDEGPEPLGNGAKFTYWTTPEPTTSGQTCAGQRVIPPTIPLKTSVHCVTSVGTVNGVQRRVQELVSSLLAAPLFEVEGILGYQSVSVKNGGRLEGEVGTDGIITLSENVTVAKCDYLSPSGKVEESPSGKCVSTTPELSPFVPPLVPIGDSAISANQFGECVKPAIEEIKAAKNCDLLIPNGINKINKPEEEDPVTGKVEFNPLTRSLSMSNGSGGTKASLELKGGIYNFCDFQVSATNATLKIAPNAIVKIFIDSALREPQSGCKSDINSKGELEAGKLVFKNGFVIENPNTNATSLQIYLYDGSGGPVKFENNSSSGSFYGTIVAPGSTVEIKNNGEFVGAIEAKEVVLVNNFTFKWQEDLKELRKEIKPHYERRAWEECPPTYTGTNFQEGC